MTERARERLLKLLAYCDAFPEDADPEAVAYLREQLEALGPRRSRQREMTTSATSARDGPRLR